MYRVFSVIPRVSAMDILISAQTSRGVDAGQARARAEEYLTKVGIAPKLWDMYPATFSGGEKQRLNHRKCFNHTPAPASFGRTDRVFGYKKQRMGHVPDSGFKGAREQP